MGSTAADAPGPDHEQRDAARSLSSRTPTIAVIGATAEDTALRDVLSAVLVLRSARSQAGDADVDRLDDAIRALDDLVRAIRSELRAGNAVHVLDLDATPGAAGGDLVTKATITLTAVDHLLLDLWTDALADADGDARDRLVDGTRLVRLARMALTGRR